MENLTADALPETPGRAWNIVRWVRLFLTIASVIILVVVLAWVAIMIIWSNPPPVTYGVALADLDGDGDLDAFYANGQNEGPRPNTVLINQGGAQGGKEGVFKDSGQRLGKEESKTPVLTDLDGDGDLDAWVANMGYQSLFLNDGQGRFTAFTHLVEENMGGTGSWEVAFGDLDGDGDQDAVGAGCCGGIASYGDGRNELFMPYNLVWFNQGGRQGGQVGRFFTDSIRYRLSWSTDRDMTSFGAGAVALGDLDDDGDLDAFFANDSLMQVDVNQREPAQPDTVWINPGDGMLADSGQRLGSAYGMDVALGDLDGDGDLDAFVANRGPDEVWLNGASGKIGEFTDSGQRIATGATKQVILSDLDGDSDLDVLRIIQDRLHVEVWLNDGRGHFSDSGQRIANPKAQAYTLGDLDGDGDADLFAGWYDTGYAVWWNQGNGVFNQ